jgi:hypothetical protein
MPRRPRPPDEEHAMKYMNEKEETALRTELADAVPIRAAGVVDILVSVFEKHLDHVVRGMARFSEEQTASLAATRARAEKAEANASRLDIEVRRFRHDAAEARTELTKAQSMVDHLRKHLDAEEGARVRETKALREELNEAWYRVSDVADRADRAEAELSYAQQRCVAYARDAEKQLEAERALGIFVEPGPLASTQLCGAACGTEGCSGCTFGVGHNGPHSCFATNAVAAPGRP